MLAHLSCIFVIYILWLRSDHNDCSDYDNLFIFHAVLCMEKIKDILGFLKCSYHVLVRSRSPWLGDGVLILVVELVRSLLAVVLNSIIFLLIVIVCWFSSGLVKCSL